MAATTEPTTTADVVALHNQLTRLLFANFHRKLTFEEASEAAAEALAEADRAMAGGQQIGNLNAWLRTAAWRNAISMIRHLEGEGRRKRLRPVDISEQREWRQDPRDVEDEILTRAGRRTEHHALARVWARLKPDEQRAVYLRYFDELSVDEVLQILGCSRHHYENLTKRALRKLREALVEGADDVGCRACRTAIVDSRFAPLPPDAAAERDAHLSSCLMCKAFQRRQRGLIAVLPLPAVGFADRLVARFHAFGGTGSAQHGEVAAGAVAAAGAGTTAGAGAVSAGGGGLLTLGAAGKTAAVLCSAGAVTAGVCATVAPLRDATTKKSPAARVAKAAAPKRPASQPPPLVPVTPRTQATPASPPRSAQRPAAAAVRRTAAIERRERTERARKASSPFLPESAAPPRPTASSPATAAARPVTYSSTASPHGSARPASSESTAFSEEFTP
jgi:RNA polymerase sigma factor (sigma-70 family)